MTPCGKIYSPNSETKDLEIVMGSVELDQEPEHLRLDRMQEKGNNLKKY